MKLIVGLGNPGNTYKNTRHNMGFLCIEALRRALGSEDWKDSRFFGVTSFFRQTHKEHTEKIWLLKPTTFMNNSGKAVASMIQFYTLDPQKDLLVLSDDLDMDFGKIRYRIRGSHGGQRGLGDIIEKIGTDAFARIKIGIGRDRRQDAANWVLSSLSTQEIKQCSEEIFPLVQERIHTWLTDTL